MLKAEHYKIRVTVASLPDVGSCLRVGHRQDDPRVIWVKCPSPTPDGETFSF